MPALAVAGRALFAVGRAAYRTRFAYRRRAVYLRHGSTKFYASARGWKSRASLEFSGKAAAASVGSWYARRRLQRRRRRHRAFRKRRRR